MLLRFAIYKFPFHWRSRCPLFTCQRRCGSHIINSLLLESRRSQFLNLSNIKFSSRNRLPLPFHQKTDQEGHPISEAGIHSGLCDKSENGTHKESIISSFLLSYLSACLSSSSSSESSPLSRDIITILISYQPSLVH